MNKKIAKKDQHGIFQNFQSDVTEYNTRESLLSGRGGTPHDRKKLYGLSPEHPESYIPKNEKPGTLSTRYVPGRPGVQAQRVSDGVFQDPHTKELFNYNEGFKTSDGRVFNGGSVDLQTDLINLAKKLHNIGMIKESRFLRDSIKIYAADGTLEDDDCDMVCKMILNGCTTPLNPNNPELCSKLTMILKDHQDLCSEIVNFIENADVDEDLDEDENLDEDEDLDEDDNAFVEGGYEDSDLMVEDSYEDYDENDFFSTRDDFDDFDDEDYDPKNKY
jgi:hypothetical protein